MSSKIPNEWFCPITIQLMFNPVIGPDGHTYEKEAIEKWLINNNSSPITKAPMFVHDLIPNIALRNTIEEFTSNKKVDFNENKKNIIPSKVLNNKISSSCIVSKLENGNLNIHISVIPSKNGNRIPSVVIAIIDVSGSMNSAVSTDKEEHGFSRLDLVRHTMKTIIPMMNNNDYLGIITFSTDSKIILPLTQMSSTGQLKAIQTIDSLKTEGNTNIWSGLQKAIDMSKLEICENKNVFSVLLTDGESNINPPRGIITTLNAYIKERQFKGTLSTFGFGYSLDSNLLDEVATLLNGIFAFIPDATMVGTVFTNYISNCLACIQDNTKVDIDTNGDIIKILGNTDISMLQYGQTRNIMFEVIPSADLSFKYTINNEIITINFDNISLSVDNETIVQFARFFMIQCLKQAINEPINKAQISVNNILEKLKEVYAITSDSRIREMIKDFHSSNINEGQITRAFSREDWFNKWGRHYILSVIKAHTYQQCNNFKDPGVQFYGGSLFGSLRDEADNMFCSLPPPEPSIRRYSQSNTQSNTQPPSMSVYYNSSGGCFGGNSIVHMKDGFKKVSEICKDDIIENGAKVICVINTIITKGQKSMVNINGLEITEWHPILNENNIWIFPVENYETKIINIDMVYNFVLDSKHIITINDTQCCTLAHGFTDNNVIKHPYFGTNKIIKELSEIDGWKDGNITISDVDFLHNGDITVGIKR